MATGISLVRKRANNYRFLCYHLLSLGDNDVAIAFLWSILSPFCLRSVTWLELPLMISFWQHGDHQQKFYFHQRQ